MGTYNPDLVYQVVRAKILNKKRPIASAKDRSEVRGGGKKPWPQKGTGRARHGSIRSPLFKGGGVTFGPRKERNYRKKVSSRMADSALAMVLEKKREDKEIREVKGIEVKGYKTKYLAKWLKEIVGEGSALVVPDENVLETKRIGRNIPRVTIRDAKNIDVVDILKHKYLVITAPALKVLRERVIMKQESKRQRANVQRKRQA